MKDVLQLPLSTLSPLSACLPLLIQLTVVLDQLIPPQLMCMETLYGLYHRGNRQFLPASSLISHALLSTLPTQLPMLTCNE